MKEPTYRTRLATGAEDIRAAQKLRFEVFNVELQEGLKESWETHLDIDRFDEVCDHLIIEHCQTGQIVGTYRLQTGTMAAQNHGYYSAQEFDFTPLEKYRANLVELGRACVHKDFRKMNVLNMLWRGIGDYATERDARYLIGCSSLTSQDAALGHATYLKMAPYLAPEDFRTVPLPAYQLPPAEPMENCPELPRLLRSYLNVGAKICGPPALDREFSTIDFLTVLDRDFTPSAVRNRFLT